MIKIWELQNAIIDTVELYCRDNSDYYQLNHISDADQADSAVQIALGATANTVTGGYNITGGFFESGGQQLGSAGSGGKALDNAILLGSKIDGTLDTIVLCARPIAGSTNVDIEAALTWRELL